jgi:hypothetical protein
MKMRAAVGPIPRGSRRTPRRETGACLPVVSAILKVKKNCNSAEAHQCIDLRPRKTPSGRLLQPWPVMSGASKDTCPPRRAHSRLAASSMSAFAPQTDVRDISPDDQKLTSIVAAKYAPEPQIHVQCGKAERDRASKPLTAKTRAPLLDERLLDLRTAIAAENVETDGS